MPLPFQTRGGGDELARREQAVIAVYFLIKKKSRSASRVKKNEEG